MMKIIFSIAIVSSLFATTQAQIKFETYNPEKNQKKAARKSKLIMVDVTASWCGWCTFMNKNVFKDKAVGDFYNKAFVNVKLDADTETGKAFSEKYGVEGLPTFIFLDEKGNMVHKISGAVKETDAFISEGEDAVKHAQLLQKNPSEMNLDELGSLLVAKVEQQEAYKPVFDLLIAHEAFKSNEQAQYIVLSLAKYGDIASADYILDNKNIFGGAESEDLIQGVLYAFAEEKINKLVYACLTAERALTFDEIYALADKECKRYLKEEGKTGFLSSRILGAATKLDAYELSIDAVVFFEDKFMSKRPFDRDVAETYVGMANVLANLSPNQNLLSKALGWANKASKFVESKALYTTFAIIHEGLGNHNETQKYKELAKEAIDEE
jgi:thioredoxin-related protein